MQVSTVLSFLAVALVTANGFSPEEQAIWIDRFNFFRTTGLPWSAGNMRRIGWSSKLAKSAASTAAKCSATTSAGVNVYQSSSTKSSSSIIDEAIQQWVVETSKTTLKTLKQPSAAGVEIGKGSYNSYSQVLWAKTSSVGCATASCSGGAMVACHFSPAGNDGSSAWYVHANSASMCPSGTKASQNLCVAEGDAANSPIAPIPAGKLTYEIYPSYVVDIQAVLAETSRAIANGEKIEPATPASSPSTSSKAPATTRPKGDVSATKPNAKADNNTTKADPSKKTTADQASAPKSPSTSGETDKTSTSDKTVTPTPSKDSTSKAGNKQTPSSPDGKVEPGTVKASDDTGATFTNQAETEKTSSNSTDKETSPMSKSDSTTSISNQSSETSEGGISVAGIAGMIVLAIVVVAAFGVIVSYKRNQRRQREILRDGGIRLI